MPALIAGMRSAELDLSRYDTDKVPNGYLKIYDPILLPYVGKDVALLELGVHTGGSLLLWRDYFPRGTIVGVDRGAAANLKGQERIRCFQGEQQDTEFLSRVARQAASGGFDIIIDDASHMGAPTRASFWHLFDNHLKAGGLYVIEDWGTGYWSDWPDGSGYGPNHSSGMVGFIKELVDEQGAHDWTRGSKAGKSTRQSKFESVLVTPSIVFVRKPGQG